jgi:putative phosphoribosyl transferase
VALPRFVGFDPRPAGNPVSVALPVAVGSGGKELLGDLEVPTNAVGLVVFAHGTGSSRFSPRNRLVARALRDNGFATLLLDLLTADEEQTDLRTRELRFDVGLLADRVLSALDRMREHEAVRGLPVGLFGASTGAAAALIAAAGDQSVRAVVSRGGRPDLAGDALHDVEAPTLMIVGGRDPRILEANQLASRELSAPHRIEVIPGATHLFEEPGALERVAALAAAWFGEHLKQD